MPQITSLKMLLSNRKGHKIQAINDRWFWKGLNGKGVFQSKLQIMIWDETSTSFAPLAYSKEYMYEGFIYLFIF